MKRFYFSRLLTLAVVVLGWNISVTAQTGVSTFPYTGATATYTVPLGSFTLTIDAYGGRGGLTNYTSTSNSYANGGRVQCTLTVTPGQVLQVNVGGQGATGNGGYGTPGTPNNGGFNGGGSGRNYGGGGGGATDIRNGAYGLSNRLIVSGGGGGWAAAYSNQEYGGQGGGLTGGNGYVQATTSGSTEACYAGQGGTPSAGGLGGTCDGTSGATPKGAFGLGGNASTNTYYAGGGGGGGYYGGGGGYYYGSGGGGSSYTDPTLATGVTHTQGFYNAVAGGNGLLMITANCTSPVKGSIVPPAAPFCGVGQSVLFTDPTGSVGGVWSSGNTAVATIDPVTGILTTVAAGSSTVPDTATINYTINYFCGSAQAQYVVSVYGFPAAIGGNAPVCQGLTVALGEAGTGTWSSSNTGLATVTPGPGPSSTLTGILAGNPTITYTLPSGCMSTTTATVSPVPVAITTPAGGTGFCAGTNITLSDASAGGTWKSGTIGVATISAGGVVSSSGASGTSIISYTFPPVGATPGCQVTTTVTVNPVPTAYTLSGGTAICAGASASLTTNASDLGTSYQLYQNGVAYKTPIPGIGGTGITYSGISPTATSTYSVVATTSFGCVRGLTPLVTVTVNPSPVAHQLVITGDTIICSGSGAQVDIAMDSTETGVTYELFNSLTPGVPIGFAGIAFGTADFGDFSAQGVYTAVASNSFGCTSNVHGQANIVVFTPPDSTYMITPLSGAASYCPGTPAPSIGITNSDLGIRYDLIFNGVTVVKSLFGSGAGLDFGRTSIYGNYTIIATNTSAGCTSHIPNSVTISPNPVPNIYSIASEGNTYCFGGAGIDLKLSGQDPLTTYQLFNNGVAVPLADYTGISSPDSLDLMLHDTGSNYTVVATNNFGCVANMTGSAAIAAYPKINPYPITSGGAYCVGGLGVDISLTGGSDAGITYQLMTGATQVGSGITGTGGLVDFMQNPIDTYYVVATNHTTGCSVTMPGVAIVTTNPLPDIDTVSGGGNFCTGGTGVHVGMKYSDLGIKYQLYNNGVAVAGFDLPGSSSALDYGLTTVTGTYRVIATNTATTCSDTMSGSAVVTNSPPPAVYTVSGSGSSYCAGGAGIDVMLSASDAGISYQFMYNGAAIDTAVAGTGLALDFGNQTFPGVYTVVASNGPTGCSSNMFGSVPVVINPLPNIYPVTGGGSFCAGSTPAHVGLKNSDATISYQLYKGTPVGSPVTGFGSSLDFGAQAAGGNYTVIATNIATSCTSNMSGIANVNVLPVPNAYPVSGGGTQCLGGGGFNIGLDTTDNGISYQLYNSGTPAGVSVAGTNVAINFGIFKAAGTYTVVATNNASHCTSNMTGSATINVNPLPGTFTVYGGGAYCAGAGGKHVFLSGSSLGDNYQLYNGSAPVGAFMTGTTSFLDFGADTASGVYTIVATDALTGCNSTMSSSTSVTENPLPTAYTVTGGGHYCTGGTGADVTLSSSMAGITYQLYNGFTPMGVSRSGAGITLDFGLQTMAGPYTIVATDMVSGCTNNMTGSTSVTIDPLVTPLVTIATGSGDTVCAGVVDNFVANPVNGGASPAYIWSTNGVPVAAGDTFSYVPANGDIVAVTMTSDANCISSPTAGKSIIMSVMPFEAASVNITATPAPVVCQGTSVTYNAAPVNGGLTPTYSWVLNSTIVASGTSYTYTPVNDDVLIFLLGSSYPCRTSADTVLSNTIKMEVDPNTPPTVSIYAHPGTLLAPGQADTLDASATFAGLHPMFQWSVNGAPVPGATNARYIDNYYYAVNAISCQVTSSNACGLSSFNGVTINVRNVGVTEINAVSSDISVLPNPNKGAFTVKGSLGSTDDQEVTIEITNMLGQSVYNNKVTAAGGNINERIQLSNTIAPGMYILSLHAGAVNNVYHVVIEQ